MIVRKFQLSSPFLESKLHFTHKAMVLLFFWGFCGRNEPKGAPFPKRFLYTVVPPDPLLVLHTMGCSLEALSSLPSLPIEGCLPVRVYRCVKYCLSANPFFLTIAVCLPARPLWTFYIIRNQLPILWHLSKQDALGVQCRVGIERLRFSAHLWVQEVGEFSSCNDRTILILDEIWISQTSWYCQNSKSSVIQWRSYMCFQFNTFGMTRNKSLLPLPLLLFLLLLLLAAICCCGEVSFGEV